MPRVAAGVIASTSLTFTATVVLLCAATSVACHQDALLAVGGGHAAAVLQTGGHARNFLYAL